MTRTNVGLAKVEHTLPRSFEMTLAVGDLGEEVNEVLDYISDGTVGVLAPGKSDVCSFFENDPLELLESSPNQVDIRRWLPVVCQGISICDGLHNGSWDDEPVGIYRHSLKASILPHEPGLVVAGPASFTGQIYLTKHRRRDAIQATLAHELIHAIRMMSFVVPAFQDWEGFRTHILPEAQLWSVVVEDVVTLIDLDRAAEPGEFQRFFGSKAARLYQNLSRCFHRPGTPPTAVPPPVDSVNTPPSLPDEEGPQLSLPLRVPF